MTLAFDDKVKIDDEVEIELEPEIPKRENKRQRKNMTEGYIKLYLIDFTLPSRSVARIRTITDKIEEFNPQEIEKRELIRMTTIIDALIAKKIESIRRSFYDLFNRKFGYTQIGWIAIDEKGVQYAEELNKRLKGKIAELLSTEKAIPNQIKARLIEYLSSRYYIKPIEILVNYNDAMHILNQLILELKEGVDELENKIEQAKNEQKLLALKKYESTLKYQKELLKQFEKFYSSHKA